MATIGMEFLTYADLAKRMKDETIQAIVEVLNETNPILNDMPVMQCNNGLSHRSTLRVKLPDVAWRSINQGVPVSKSETKQIDDTSGMLSVWAQVDRRLASLYDNERDFMMSEESAFVEAMNQEMAASLFYGNTEENQAKFTGLAPRYSTLDTTKADTANYIVDAGGTGATNTSIWIVFWDPRTIHGIYPKGIPAGLQRTHRKDVTLRDRDGKQFIGHESNYEWTLGLAVRDYRYVVRIANVDVGAIDDIIENGASNAAKQKLIRVLLKGLKIIPNKRVGRPVIYCNRTVSLMLDIMASEKGNVNLTMSNFEGETVTAFKGIPIHEVDAIRDDEVAVV